jgi:hypothetical protein
MTRAGWRSNALEDRQEDWSSPSRSGLLAALRGGIKTMLIPEENAKDLVEIADSIKSGLEIVPVLRMDEVLARAMTREPTPIEWDETTTTAAAVPEEVRSSRKPRRSRELNDRDTGAEAAVTSQNFIHSSKLGDPAAHWAETTTILPCVRLRKDTQ